MASGIPQLIDAFEQTLRCTVGVAGTLSDAEWALPTDCPGWTVQDIVSHLVGVERVVRGEPEPDHRLPDGLTYLRHETARRLELAVDYRRALPPDKVLAELRSLIDLRVAELRSLAAGDADPEIESGYWGRRTLSRALRTRVFDAWVHEQDIRRATGRPGGLDSPAAQVTRGFLARVLPHVVEQAGLPEGTAVRFDVTGEQEIHESVGEGEPALTIGTDWETFVRLTCGRVEPGLAKVEATGDPGQVERVLAAFAVTP
jgi:uncharacterized protein (TIGR03083 family)